MSLLNSSNPIMLGLLAASLVASAGSLVLRRPAAAAFPGGTRGLAFWTGLSGFLATWLVFVPVNGLAHVAGDSDSWIFGSERFDGGVVETLTVVFYLFAIGQAALLLRRADDLYGTASAGLWRLILGLGLVGFVLMIGEEISWGQHWMGFRTPDELASVNLQGEANVHNLVSPRLYDAIYQALGWSLILLPAAATFLKDRLPGLSVLAFLRGCYVWPLTYPLMVSSGVLLQHEVFEELSEMVLAVTVFQTLLSFGRYARPGDPLSAA